MIFIKVLYVSISLVILFDNLLANDFAQYFTRIRITFLANDNRHATITCSGIFIHSYWILTAAHCMNMPPISVTFDYNLADKVTSKPVRLNRAPKNVYFLQHPNYTLNGENSFIFDIALIKLSQVPKFPDNVMPVKVLELDDSPWPRNSQQETVDRDCIISSFGTNKFHTHSIAIRYHWKNCECPLISANILCTKNISVLCSGDSGAAIICNNKTVGILNKGGSCNGREFKCNETGFVHTFAYLCPHIAWIKRYVPIQAKPCYDPLDFQQTMEETLIRSFSSKHFANIYLITYILSYFARM
ncbi:hypothetical protein O3M35_003057 [Rhynocoris fuscipes]|uniref:Peptidase S1 domain-containing protein n=1 Tax=Rhynocoris fuscipes TaxID=488301 RepID=A0AAW1CPH8_9HEMI